MKNELEKELIKYIEDITDMTFDINLPYCKDLLNSLKNKSTNLIHEKYRKTAYSIVDKYTRDEKLNKILN